MRALSIILFTAVATLWIWFVVAVAPLDSRRPRPVQVIETESGVTAASLHNRGVSLHRQGQHGDALLYFERAHSFRPLEATFEQSYARQQSYIAKRAWARVLIPLTLLAIVLMIVMGVRRTVLRRRDRRRLRGLRLRGDNWFRIRAKDKSVDMKLRFNHEVEGVIGRHPLTIVWSSARHGKHMKSQPPVETSGRHALVKLDGERLQRLRRFPGEWKGFLYLDGQSVGEATARVG